MASTLVVLGLEAAALWAFHKITSGKDDAGGAVEPGPAPAPAPGGKPSPPPPSGHGKVGPPNPNVQPPPQPPPGPLVWNAPRNLTPAPNVPPKNVVVDASQGTWAAIGTLRAPANPPTWLALATMELAGGLALPNLPDPIGDHFPPMGLTPQQAAGVLEYSSPGINPTPVLVKGVLNDPGRNFAAGAILLKLYYDEAIRVVRDSLNSGELGDIAHVVRIAWLDGPGAFDKIRATQAPPGWYVAGPAGGLSQQEAWDRAFRRWYIATEGNERGV